MAGTVLQFDLSGISRLEKRLAKLAHPDTRSLLDALGAEGESQTRRRLDEEKTGPDGKAWPEWSERYAATRRSGQSLLVAGGDLLDSIQHLVSGDTAEWGTNLIYGAIQQFGGEEVGMNIPPRPYLGLSPENMADLEAVVDNWVDAQLEAL